MPFSTDTEFKSAVEGTCPEILTLASIGKKLTEQSSSNFNFKNLKSSTRVVQDVNCREMKQWLSNMNSSSLWRLSVSSVAVIGLS